MKKLNLSQYEVKSYGIDAAHHALSGTNANLMSCRLPPGGRSEAHNHFEREIFICLAGKGVAGNGRTSVLLEPGEAVYFEGFEGHTLDNLDLSNPLKLLSIYWEQKEDDITPAQKTEHRTLIFSAPPTPNGDLHLGHLSGPYLAADVLRRALRSQGKEAYHFSGRDDHQTYVKVAALREQMSPESLSDKYALQFRATWESVAVDVDGFTEPRIEDGYVEFIQEAVQRLVKNGTVYEKDHNGLFDENGKYYHEGYVRGQCPVCSSLSDGGACEACGQPNDPVDLERPESKINTNQLHREPVRRLYFRLSAFQDRVLEYARMSSMPTRVSHLCHLIAEDGLKDICISHQSDWGIKHTSLGFESHIIYVWIELGLAYLWRAAQHSKLETSDIWLKIADAYENDIVHCYGFDNAFYHVILYPALYLALDCKISLPRTHIVNELLDLDGEKFSTSRRHLIWAKDLLKDVPADYVRFMLSLYRPEGVRSNFNVTEALSFVNRTFGNDLQSWMSDLQKALELSGNAIPEPGAWLADQRTFYTRVLSFIKAVDCHLSIDGFSPRAAAYAIMEMISDGARFTRSQRDLIDGQISNEKNYTRTSIAIMAFGMHAVAKTAAPLIPSISKSIISYLDSDGFDAGQFLPGGHIINSANGCDLPITSTSACKPSA